MTAKPSVASRKHLWIPGCFILFFICLAVLEVWFVTIATQSFTGVVTDDAYVTGLNYNETLARHDAERTLGWTTAIHYAQGEYLGGIADA